MTLGGYPRAQAGPLRSTLTLRGSRLELSAGANPSSRPGWIRASVFEGSSCPGVCYYIHRCSLPNFGLVMPAAGTRSPQQVMRVVRN